MAELGLSAPPAVIHVVGSNGKGSVSAMCAAALNAAGTRTGLFTSPHVLNYRERISVAGRWVTEAEVVAFVRRAARLTGAYGFFELTLGLALEHFAREHVKVAVIEAGIGAKGDATMAVDNVTIVLIPSISLEHQDILGPTLEAIVLDKAAALRPGVHAYTGAAGEALALLAAAARRQGAQLKQADALLMPTNLPYQTGFLAQNQRLVYGALKDLGLAENAIRSGLAARLPARLEPFSLNGVAVILDGAHNPAAARALLTQLPASFVLLFGGSEKKQERATLAALAPAARKIFLTRARRDVSSVFGGAPNFFAEPADALKTALAACQKGDTLLISGSFYLAAALRPLLLQLQGAQP